MFACSTYKISFDNSACQKKKTPLTNTFYFKSLSLYVFNVVETKVVILSACTL